MEASRLLQSIAGRLSGRRLDWLLAFVALVIALLPAHALAPWTNTLARIAFVPMAPLTHAGMFLRDRIRPPRAAFDPRAPEVMALAQEAEQFRTLYESARLQSERLERSLGELGAVSTRVGEQGVRFIEASVTGGDPTRAAGVVRINAGTRHGVTPRAPVFLDGDVLAGMVADEVGPFSATVIPSTRLSGILVRILPAAGSDPRVPLSSYPRAVLKPTPNGGWSAEVPAAEGLAVGATVRFEDDRYPRAALGTRVGVVSAVEPLDQAPLARRIEVAPIRPLAEALSVVVVSPEVAEDADRGGAR